MWQKILSSNITSYEKLVEILELSDCDRAKVFKKSDFPLNVPQRLVQKMQKKTLEDPLFRQFVPIHEENIEKEGFNENPIGDCESRKAPKLLHKYKGRSLILTTSACAMHCRFCVRKEFGYSKDSGFEEELEVLAKDELMREVLLSGGDPLSLSDRVLGDLLGNLDKIPHVERIRFHTRFILGIPERIDDSFILALRRFKRNKIFVLHINHPKELDDQVFEALDKLKRENILLFSQTVLLRGVNDDVETLSKLFLKLIDSGIVPYYLHQLDRVRGSHHFEVPIEEGKKLMELLQRELPGYAIPSYVQEVAKMPYKIIL
jgi:lysine 2,3-aminomutase